jgi:hypothetical protein
LGLKTAKRDIAGMEVRTTQFPALRAMGLLTTLGRILSGSAGKLASVAGGSTSIGDLDIGSAASAIGALFEQVDATEAQQIAKDILAQTSVVTDEVIEDLAQKGAIDRVFSGSLLVMFKVMAFALEVNFGDFLDGIGGDADEKKGTTSE